MSKSNLAFMDCAWFCRQLYVWCFVVAFWMLQCSYYCKYNCKNSMQNNVLPNRLLWDFSSDVRALWNCIKLSISHKCWRYSSKQKPQVVLYQSKEHPLCTWNRRSISVSYFLLKISLSMRWLVIPTLCWFLSLLWLLVPPCFTRCSSV